MLLLGHVTQLLKPKRQVIERPFLVVRAAGSGMEGSGDLLALRGDLCFPIEVKTSKNQNCIFRVELGISIKR